MRTNPKKNDFLRTAIIIPIILSTFALVFAMKAQSAAKIILQKLGSSLILLEVHWTVDSTGYFVSLLNKMKSGFGRVSVYNRRSELSLTSYSIGLAAAKPLTFRAA